MTETASSPHSTAGVPDPDRIAAAVSALPDVAGLHGGLFGEVATYLPGRRVTGVQVGEARISVHITARLSRPVPAIAAEVREVVLPLAQGFPVDIVVEDIVVEDVVMDGSSS